MAKDRFRKYIWIVDRLYRSGGLTYKELVSQWERSSLNSDGSTIARRTFDDYKRAIEDTFDLNIICNASDDYRYQIENREDISRDNIKSWLLSSFSVNNIIQESRKLRRRILFERIPSGNDQLLSILEAMQESKRIRITYQGYYHEAPKEVVADPYCVKVYRQCWYVVVFVPEHQQLRTYALDRIQSLELTEEIFAYSESFDAEAHFAHCFGIINGVEDTPLEVVRVKVYELGYKRQYIRSLPLHSSQVEVETAEDYSVFEYCLYPTYDFLQEILSHGSELEVLAPQWVRDELASMIKDMYALYY